MKLGGIAALTGASKPIDYTAQDQREFAQMDNIEKSLEQDKQASMVAQKIEADAYEQLSAKAAELLEPDRIKIRHKSLELQKNIRSKIEEYGSRKAFFENGGIALLSKYKTDVLNSEETLKYVDNKKNMEQLMKIMETGKGHLISEIDKQRLDDYNAGIGDGKITYSGMKSEVVVPEKYFNYGEEVPAEIILKSNYLPIYNNWLLDNPELSYLQGDALKQQLMEYTYTHHYGEGTNMIQHQSDVSQAALEKQQRALRTSGTNADTDIPPDSYVATANQVFNQIQSSKDPATVSKLMEPVNFLQKSAANNVAYSSALGNLDAYDSSDVDYQSAGMVDAITKKLGRAVGVNNTYSPASAVRVKADTRGVLDYLYPGSENANSVAIPFNNGMIYSPNGNKLSSASAKEMIEEGKDKGAIFGGLIYAYVDGQGNMVTQIRDSEGKNLGKKDKTGKYHFSDEENSHSAMFKGSLRNEMFAVLTTADGQKYYQKVPSNDYIGETQLAVAIGKSDDTRIARERQQNVARLKTANEINNKMNADLAKTYVEMASSNGGVFDSPEFKAESSISKVADGSNRYELHKAYYMAMSHMKEGRGREKGTVTPQTMLQDNFYKKSSPNNFSKNVGYKPSIKNALINKNKYSDEDFINFMVDETTNKNDPQEVSENTEFKNVWLQYYQLLKS